MHTYMKDTAYWSKVGSSMSVYIALAVVSAFVSWSKFSGHIPIHLLCVSSWYIHMICHRATTKAASSETTVDSL